MLISFYSTFLSTVLVEYLVLTTFIGVKNCISVTTLHGHSLNHIIEVAMCSLSIVVSRIHIYFIIHTL